SPGDEWSPPGAEAAGVSMSPHPASLAAAVAAAGMGWGPPTRVSRRKATKVTAPRPPIHAARLAARAPRIRRNAVPLARRTWSLRSDLAERPRSAVLVVVGRSRPGPGAG